MARISVPFLGHTTRPNPTDGECRSLVNLKPKNSFKKPVAPRMVTDSLDAQYNIIFLHRGNGYTNWIGISDNKVYSNIKGARILLASVAKTIKSVQQIGNTLLFITHNNIYYAIYLNNTYTYLGEFPELPVYQWDTVSASIELTPKQGSGLNSHTHEELRANVKATVHKAMDLLVNGGKDEENNDYVAKGQHLFDAHFIRYAYRLYDGSLTHYSPPILLMPQTSIHELKQFVEGVPDKVRVVGYHPRMSLLNIKPIPAQWKDVIKSIDVFMSQPVGLSNIDDMANDIDLMNIDHSVFQTINLLPNISQKNLEAVRSIGTFYLVHSLSIESLPYMVNLLTDTTGGDSFKNLIYQELMPVAPLSFHKVGSKKSTSYNNRIRLLGANSEIFKGFLSAYFAFVTYYNGTSSLAQIKGGGSTPSVNVSKILCAVKINVNGVSKTLVTEHTPLASNNLRISAFLSYPDPRATEIKIYVYGSSKWYHLCTEKLQPHNHLNIAYAIIGDLKPAGWEFSEVSDPLLNTTETYVVEESNKLKVSELNNPFVFPNENTYLIGTGDIFNESSIIMNVTDRNYGMYPVFVFTSDGVYTMAAQTPETVHASIQAPSYMEAPISDVLCPTPYGVAFVTHRGLMMISQHETRFISPELREDDDTLNFFDGAGNPLPITGLYPSVSFIDYISGLSTMIYNPHNDEMIISNNNYAYSYVYDLPSKSFYISTEKIDQQVLNAYPQILVGENTATGMKLKDYSKVGKKATEVMIVTRPLSFGSLDLKKLDRVILRAIMYNVNQNSSNYRKLELSVFYSDDSVNFRPALGRRFSTVGNYKDFDLGLMARMKFRHYVFMLTGTIDDDSDIQYAEFEVAQEYNNQKMR